MKPCVICQRPADDPLHGALEPTGLAHDTTPRVEQHAYDPGERRTFVRRTEDRQRLAWDKARDEHDAEVWNREHPPEEPVDE